MSVAGVDLPVAGHAGTARLLRRLAPGGALSAEKPWTPPIPPASLYKPEQAPIPRHSRENH